MISRLGRASILFIVFLTGAAVLILEVLASRILTPYFGNTIFTFSSILGIILAALSCGYYVGGWWVDRKAALSHFFGLITAAGLSVLVLKILIHLFGPEWGYKLSMISGPLVASLALFFLPAFFLGTLSPFAIQLIHVAEHKKAVGKTAGQVFFWSTLGSISGSLTAGFLLIPHFGVSHITLGIAFFLIGLGSLGTLITVKKKVRVALLLCLLTLLLSLFYEVLPEGTPADVIFRQDGLYEQISIIDHQKEKRPTRLLMQDLSNNSGEYRDTGTMLFPYTKYYSLYEIFTPQPKRILAIGGGAYSVPKELLREQKEAIVDVAETEPKLFPLARKYFGLPDNPRLLNHIEDGRRFLHETPHHYDIIFSDVYYSFAAVPMHCSTQEFFREAYEKLNDQGIFIANFAGSLESNPESLIKSVIKTLKTVFPQVYVFSTVDRDPTEAQNFILLGHKNETRISLQKPIAARDPYGILDNLSSNEITLTEADLANALLLTDDYAPVEYLLSHVLRSYDKI